MNSLLALQRDAKPNPVSAARAALDAAEMFDVRERRCSPARLVPRRAAIPVAGMQRGF